MNIWLVNDRLTCMPGARTFWMDLLEEFDMVDKCGVRFDRLAASIEMAIGEEGEPDIIVRNGTYFRQIRSTAKQIAFVQDLHASKEVLESADLVVWTTEYIRWWYETNRAPVRVKKSVVIPVGMDFEFWCPSVYNHEGPIMFVGHPVARPKGWPDFERLMDAMPERQFQTATLTAPFPRPRPNLTIYKRQSSVQMRELYRQASLLVCCSVTDPQHLTGTEAGACGLPIVATNVGIYWNRQPASWGMRYEHDACYAVEYTLRCADVMQPRLYWQNQGMTKPQCMARWKEIL